MSNASVLSCAKVHPPCTQTTVDCVQSVTLTFSKMASQPTPYRGVLSHALSPRPLELKNKHVLTDQTHGHLFIDMATKCVLCAEAFQVTNIRKRRGASSRSWQSRLVLRYIYSVSTRAYVGTSVGNTHGHLRSSSSSYRMLHRVSAACFES